MVLAHTRKSGKTIDEDVMVGIVLSNMRDAEMQNHLVLHQKRFSIFRQVRDEVVDINRTRMATGVIPMDVSAIGKGKGKGKKRWKER